MKVKELVWDLPKEVNFFLEKRRKKIRGEKSGIYQNDFFGFLSRHQTKSKQTEFA